MDGELTNDSARTGALRIDGTQDGAQGDCARDDSARAGAMSAPIVEVRNLVKRYGDVVALDHFDLRIEPGEIFGLLGPNGSGKTTAINCILQLLTFDKGDICLFGEPMTPTRYDLKRKIGVVPQNVALFEELTVRENIDFFCALYVDDRRERARLVDEAGIDSILVGDSLGNVILGLGDTVSVTMEDMIHHGAAVARGTKNALVVVDMPFMSYQSSVYDAVVNAGRLMKEARANAVKLEGGVEVADRIRAIVDCQIPVCAHIGLTPQGINALGGFKVQGKTADSARKLLEDAHAVEEAGAFAVVLEAIPAELAARVSAELTIPTIGIGAGAGCDGQVLVNQDMLGMFHDFTPKFVRRFAEVGDVMLDAYRAYDAAVKDGTFPAAEHTYAAPAGVLETL